VVHDGDVVRIAAVGAGLAALVGLAAIAILLVLLGSDEGTPWVDLEVGDCFDLAGAVEEAGDADPLLRVDTVPCDEPHDAEVVATGRLDPGQDREYPPDDALFDLVDRECARQLGDALDSDAYGLLPIAPDERTWTERGGHYACVAVVAGGGTVTQSVAA
jgi:hypothetical protein